MSDRILLAREDAVAVVTVNRPAVLNALDAQTLTDLRTVMSGLREDAAVRAVIVTGAGERAFVAGADIAELAALSPGEAAALSQAGQQVFDLIEQLGKPVIAAVNGFALGGGCELALACTLRVASETARFGQPEINLGLVPGFGGTQRLPRLVGRGTAMEMLLTGRQITADEAYRIGLVNRVVPARELRDAARALATQLAAQAPVAVRHIIDAVQRGAGVPLAQGEALEASLFGLTFATADMREGTRAFLDKRTPVFKGE